MWVANSAGRPDAPTPSPPEPRPPPVARRSASPTTHADGGDAVQGATECCRRGHAAIMPCSVKSPFPTQTGNRPMSLDPALRSRIESLLQSNRVVLFMKGQPTMPQCGFSAKAVGALSALGVDYAHVNVLADQDIREGIKAYGDWPTIPQLYIDGELVGGSDIIEQMSNSGELASLLGVAAPDRTPADDHRHPRRGRDAGQRGGRRRPGRARCRCRSTRSSSPTSSWRSSTPTPSPPNPTACASSSTWPARAAPRASPSTGSTTSAARAWPSTTRTRPSRCRRCRRRKPMRAWRPAKCCWSTCAPPRNARWLR